MFGPKKTGSSLVENTMNFSLGSISSQTMDASEPQKSDEPQASILANATTNSKTFPPRHLTPRWPNWLVVCYCVSLFRLLFIELTILGC